MGQEIVYCCKCNSRLTGEQFSKGKGARFEGKSYCKPCALAVWQTLSPAKKTELWALLTPSGQAVPPRPPTQAIRPSTVRQLAPARSKNSWALPVAGLVLMALGGIGWTWMSHSNPPPKPAPIVAQEPEAKPKPLPAPAPEPEPKKEEPAKSDALDLARAFKAEHPNDLEGQVRTFKKACFEMEGTPRAAEARKDLEALLAARKNQLAEEFSAVAAKAQEACRREEFGNALKTLKTARGKYDEADWTVMVDQTTHDIDRQVEELFRTLKEEAIVAKGSGFEDKSNEIRDRVAKWGIEALVTELDGLLAKMTPKPAPAPAPPTPAPPEPKPPAAAPVQPPPPPAVSKPKPVDPKREIVLGAGHMTGTGTFKLSECKGVGSTMMSQADVEVSKRRNNFVDIPFDAQSDVTYKCHVYIGGCCQETMHVFVQATDLFSGGEKRMSMEPGGGSYIGKQPSRGLPKNHADHGGLKQPTHWEWITINLPRYPSAGTKKVRLMNNQQGFCVAYAVISSEKYLSGPPQDLEEIKKLLPKR